MGVASVVACRVSLLPGVLLVVVWGGGGVWLVFAVVLGLFCCLGDI